MELPKVKKELADFRFLKFSMVIFHWFDVENIIKSIISNECNRNFIKNSLKFLKHLII